MSEVSVLIVEDEPVTRRLLEERVKGLGMQVSLVDREGGAAFHDQAIELAKGGVHIVICDLTLPDAAGGESVMAGLALMKDLRALQLGFYILLYSGSIDQESLEKMKKQGASATFSKDNPEGLNELLEAIKVYAEKPLKKKRSRLSLS